ncbi:MAG: Stp1/IreP family PP2C-type Ser/Thr phosphatase [Bacteroidia bacterium]|nr:Stp1/IreP family PP2C-type Ser/Thr phosphatase [Bacteroidia bacterium]MDW8235716.1 Stp1/IreP family PP2C-type Ser/Thr phosphatase [Bacteroidia bacterium]
MSITSHKVAALSDTGRIRSHNEDRIAYTKTKYGDLWIVCDGMGGHQAGEKAAELAIEAILDFFSRTSFMPPANLLEKALFEANAAIYKIAQAYPQYRKMGTTCVLALYQHPRVYYAHVGDSRLYYYHQGQLYQKTMDHSYVQFLVSQGILTPQEAEYHPRRNIILRALGVASRPEPEVAPEPISVTTGDIILLCSDGLNSMLTHEEIQTILETPDIPEVKAQRLIDSANAAGGDDNISVVLVEFS